MKKKATPKPRRAGRPKARQQSIPGTDPPTIRALDVAAESYVEARDERMKRTETEVERRTALIETMRKHGLHVYRVQSDEGPLIVTLAEGEAKVKVKRETEREPQEEDDAA